MDATSIKRFYFPVIKGETVGKLASAIITTNVMDRQGEMVDADGVNFAGFTANPVVLYGHSYNGLESVPVGRAVSMEVFHDNTTGNKRSGIKASWEFQADDVSPLISAVTKSWERGFLNAVSIGFLETERMNDTITQCELLEFSICPVPANPQALRLNGFTDPEIKALGVDVTPETLISDLEAMVVTKEGRVLSTKNRTLISDCVSSLTALLEASDGKMLSGDSELKPVDDWLTALYKSMFNDKK